MTEVSERAVTSAPDSQMVSGVRALAVLADDEFERNLSALRAGQDRVRRIQQALMKEGVDFGVVPGTERPTLMKPGAEKLTLAYGLVAEIATDLVHGDGLEAPVLRYDSSCLLHVGTFDGPIIAIGHGTASSHEKKYRYRTIRFGMTCPECGKEGVIKTRRNAFWHPPDAKPDGGCNANFRLDDPRLANQSSRSEVVEDPDPWDRANTLLKMSEKRSHVDAVLRATATSGLFTQDVEDDRAPVIGARSYDEPPDDLPVPDEPAEDDWSNAAFRVRLARRGWTPPQALAAAEELGIWSKGSPFEVEQRQQLIRHIDEPEATFREVVEASEVPSQSDEGEVYEQRAALVTDLEEQAAATKEK